MQEPRFVGPYRILGTLGRGGMGVVYRAEHTRTGARVALKIVPVVREDLLASLRREIHALASLDHPGIVRIRSHGMEGPLPWYAMDLVEGRTLRECVKDAFGQDGATESIGSDRADELPEQGASAWARRRTGQVRKPPAGGGDLPRLLSLTRGLCGALAYMHGEGTVHRDLKPGNILVTPDGRPIIVDFGLMLRFGGRGSREVLDADSEVVGTLGYMAPEQALGQLVDARADLYALGCVLYEVVTGRSPFPPEGTDDVLRPLAPTPPSEIVDDVHPDIEQLIARLMAREPRARLGYAEDVARILERLGAEDPFRSVAGRPRPFLFRPSLCGRRDLLADLGQTLQSGAARLILIAGESGVGKTRLAMALAATATEMGTLVLAGEAEEARFGQGGKGALAALRAPLRAIADRCLARGQSESDRIVGRRGKLLALYEPELCGLPGHDGHPDPEDLPPDAWRERLFASLTQTVAALAEQTPVVLLLDDLHAADELTVGWLRTVAAYAPPFTVVGTYRSDQESPIAHLHGPLARAVVLSRLDEAAIVDMTAEMLALPDVPTELCRFLYRHSEGSPLFVAEYLRMAVAEGLLTRDEEGHWGVSEGGRRDSFDALPTPRSVREIVARRLAGLPPPARQALAAAAILGGEMHASWLSQLSGFDEESFFHALQPLLLRQVLEEPAPGRLRFAHQQIRDAAASLLRSPERRRLHAHAARILEEAFPVVPDERLADLARHWERSGASTPAREYYRRAASAAMRRFAHDEAETLLRAYLRLARKPTPEKVKARNELGWNVLRLRGRIAESLEEHRLALAEALRIGDRSGAASSLRSIAAYHRAQGKLAEAKRLLHRALHASRQAQDPRSEGETLSGLAWVVGDEGNLEESRALSERALEIARSLQDRLWEGRELLNIAVGHEALGDQEKARAMTEAALAIFRELSSPHHEAHALHNLASFLHRQGRLHAALGLYQQALEQMRRVGYRTGEAFVLTNLGHVHFQQGRLHRAREHYEELLSIGRETGLPAHIVDALGHLGGVQFQLGNPGESERLYGEALHLVRDLGDRHRLALCLANIGTGHHEMGRPAEARACYEEAIATARASNSKDHEGFALLQLANLDHDLGRYGNARRACDQAMRLIRENGDRGSEGHALSISGTIDVALGRIRKGIRGLEQALAIHREVGDRRFEGVTLAEIAFVTSLSSDAKAARPFAERAEAIQDEVGDPFEMAKCQCVRGHIEIALGGPAAMYLRSAQEAVQELGTGPDSNLCRRVRALERALDAARRGLPLAAGFLPADLTPGIRRWLAPRGAE